MAKRWPNKRDLETTLSTLEPIPNPLPSLEQYQTPPQIAAEILLEAAFRGDVEGRVVADLGCGNGILGLGAALLGASQVICLDIDPLAVVTAWRNAWALGVVEKVRIFVCDALRFSDSVDTVIMNPPFGIRGETPDISFLVRALRCARVTYSIHREGNVDFLARVASKYGADLTDVWRYPFSIGRFFNFHRKKQVEIGVEVLRFERSS